VVGGAISTPFSTAFATIFTFSSFPAAATDSSQSRVKSPHARVIENERAVLPISQGV
jgi:hypothetical protein